jgi:hypothetical protein
MKKNSVYLFRAALYMIMLVLSKDVLFHWAYAQIIFPAKFASLGVLN